VGYQNCSCVIAGSCEWLFATEEPEPDASIEGIITAITEDPATFDGTATVEAPIEGRLRRVQVSGFERSDRDLLIDAFKQRRRVRVEGELHAEARRLRLRNPRKLAVELDDESDEGDEHGLKAD
jgi:hypothetical protein